MNTPVCPTFAPVLQRLTAIFLIVLLSFQCLVKVGLIVNFAINRDVIAATLCINRDKPEMKCNGKCHLAAQLNKNDDPEKKANFPSTTQKIEIPVFLVSDPIHIHLPATCIPASTVFHRLNDQLTQAYSGDVFHPPSVLTV